MHKVTDVSVHALCFSSSFNSVLLENTALTVQLCEKKYLISFLQSLDLFMKPCEVNTPLYLLITLHILYVCNLFLQLDSVSNHWPMLASVIVTSPWTRSRNFSPSCHNSSQEALSKHLAPPGSTDCTQSATIWIWVRYTHVIGLAWWLKQSHAGRNCFSSCLVLMFSSTEDLEVCRNKQSLGYFFPTLLS